MLKHKVLVTLLKDFAAAAFGRLCVETLKAWFGQKDVMAAAFGRLCVETPDCCSLSSPRLQPPSGGCVLKHEIPNGSIELTDAAAFGRLCVETKYLLLKMNLKIAAAFGRLCVETVKSDTCNNSRTSSRLRAAVC